MGGTGTRSYEFAKALVSKGHSVTIVCGSFDVGVTGLDSGFKDGRRDGVVDGIRVIEYQLPYSNKQSLLKRAQQFLKFSLHCCREVMSNKPDLVFCTSTPLTIAIPGIFSKLFSRRKFVFEVRDLWPELPVAMGVIKNPIVISLLKVLEVVSYKLADRVIALSGGMQQGIIKYVSETKTDVISNGCDNHLAKSFLELEGKMPTGVSHGDFVAVYSGTHGIANGLDVLIEVARELNEKKADNVKILLVGDGMCKAELMRRAEENGLKNIIFADSLPKVELFELLRQCQVGLMILKNIPAFYNGTSPNKFFDYISLGLPVLCNYPGWISNVLVEENIGVSTPPDDAVSLADALIQLSQSKEKLDSMSGNSLQLAQSQFDREKLANRFVTILESVVKD